MGTLLRNQLRYNTPVIITTAWNLGILALIFLGIQIITGILLVINYIPEGSRAFESIERIMREIDSGYLLRLLHNTSATFFFLAIYVHITRALYYGLYLFPAQKVWITGIVSWLLMMLAAFAGYVLPWGQMSYWALTVISNLLTIIPYAGNDLVVLIWGSSTITNNTVTRLFLVHFLAPFILLVVVALHLVFLHNKRSSTPLTVSINTDTVTFAPYFITKDIVVTLVIFVFLAVYLYWKPYSLLDADNSIYANPFVTPAHIVPEWYFLPYYAILRSSSDKTVGVLGLFLAILSFIFLGNLFKKITYRFISPVYSKGHVAMVLIFCAVFITLLLLGSMPPIATVVYWSQVSTWIYFGILGAGLEFILYIDNIVVRGIKFLLSYNTIIDKKIFFGYPDKRAFCTEHHDNDSISDFALLENFSTRCLQELMALDIDTANPCKSGRPGILIPLEDFRRIPAFCIEEFCANYDIDLEQEPIDHWEISKIIQQDQDKDALFRRVRAARVRIFRHMLKEVQDDPKAYTDRAYDLLFQNLGCNIMPRAFYGRKYVDAVNFFPVVQDITPEQKKELYDIQTKWRNGNSNGDGK